MEGTAFTDNGGPGAHWNRYDYNARNELIDAEQYSGSSVQPDFLVTPPGGTGINAGFSEYDYDPIGNRKRMRLQESPELETTYLGTRLNQYNASTLHFAGGGQTIVVSNQYYYDKDGNLENVELSGDANCNGVVSTGDIGAFVLAITDPAAYALAYPYCPLTNSDTNGNGVVNPADIGHFVAMTTAGNGGAVATTYTWDAENRLTSAAPTYPSNDSRRSHYSYDHRGRRVRAWTETYACGDPCTNGTWSQTPGDTDVRYLWDGWLLLAELNGSGGAVRTYSWGLDLSGLTGSLNSRTSVGGIGGLLATEIANTPPTPADSFWYYYDANGNVSQVVAPADGALEVAYEYDAYGNRLNAAQTGDLEQPFRFSTKQFDTLTGLDYYGYRYYSTRLGRWVNVDPLSEFQALAELDQLHSVDSYRFVANNPIIEIDPLGLSPSGGGSGGGVGTAETGRRVAQALQKAREAIDRIKKLDCASVDSAISAARMLILEYQNIAEAVTGAKHIPAEFLNFLLAAAQNVAAIRCRPKPSCGLDCNPCIPPIGTIMHRVDIVPPSAPHFPHEGSHIHYFVVSQSPPPVCKCFLIELGTLGGAIPVPGTLPDRPATGGGVRCGK